MYSNYAVRNFGAIENVISGKNGRLVLLAGTVIVLGSLYCYHESSEETKQTLFQNLGAILGSQIAIEPEKVSLPAIEESSVGNLLEGGKSNA